MIPSAMTSRFVFRSRVFTRSSMIKVKQGNKMILNNRTLCIFNNMNRHDSTTLSLARINRCIHVKSCLYQAISEKVEQFILPDIGEGIKEVVIKGWNVKVGDTVKEFDGICDVESDKATATISSRFEGVISKIYYEIGDNAKVGQPLVDILVKNDDVSITNNHIKTPATPDKTTIPSQPDQSNNQFAGFKMLPSVRRFAMEQKVDLSKVRGSGGGGRIEKADILAYLRQSQTKTEAVQNSTTQFRQTSQNESIEPLTSIQKAMFKTMSKSLMIPHFNYSDEIDMTRIVEWSKRHKESVSNPSDRITSLAIIIKMLSLCLNEYPMLNASIDDSNENLILKNYHNIGVAIDTQAGLVVPNVKNVQDLTIKQVNSELRRLRELGYSSKLGPADLAGGTITLSNIGAIGGVFGVPVIVAPEIVIGALGRIRHLPRFNEKGQVEGHHVLQVVWSADHRVVDGATLSRFSNLLKSYLEDPEQAILRMT